MCAAAMQHRQPKASIAVGTGRCQGTLNLQPGVHTSSMFLDQKGDLCVSLEKLQFRKYSSYILGNESANTMPKLQHFVRNTRSSTNNA